MSVYTYYYNFIYMMHFKKSCWAQPWMIWTMSTLVTCLFTFRLFSAHNTLFCVAFLCFVVEKLSLKNDALCIYCVHLQQNQHCLLYLATYI